MERVSLTILCLLLVALSFSQSLTNVCVRSNSLGNCVSVFSDPSLVFLNPSSINCLKNLHAGAQFLSKDQIQNNAAFIAFPLKKGVVGITSQIFGSKEYKLLTYGVSYGMKISDNLKLGVFIGGNNVTISHYGSRNSLNFSFAFQGNISESIRYGITLQSLSDQLELKTTQNSPVLFVGIRYKSDVSRCLLFAEIEKSVSLPLRFKVACEYLINPVFYFRTGVLTTANQLTGGVGFWFKNNYRIDLGSSWQPLLGMTMYAGILVSTKQRELHED